MRALALSDSVDGSRVAFQSTLVAAVGAVGRVRDLVREAEHAALSLAQQHKVAEVAADLDAAATALRTSLDARGRCLLPDRAGLGARVRDALAARRALSAAPAARPSWWFALSATLDALDAAAEQMLGLAAGQPPGTPARALGEQVATLFRTQHARLLSEAERWMD